MAEIFKIRSTTTGLFSSGGNSPKFTKVGKIWRTMAHVNSHLTQLDRMGKQIYKQNDVEIVTFEIQEVITKTESVAKHLESIEQKRLEHEEKMRQAREEADKRQRLATYKKLQKEFG